MEALEISRPQTERTDALVDLWVELASGQRQYGSHVRGEPNRSQIRESLFRHIASGRVLVAETDQLCGFVMFAIEQGEYEQEVQRGIIENLYVREEVRNDGVGTALLVTAEHELENQGVDRIMLSVMAANDDARRFYRRHEYEPHRVELEKSVSGDE